MIVRAAGAVGVAVRELFRRRRANVDDLDVEHERLACERMVEVEIDVEVAHLQDARMPTPEVVFTATVCPATMRPFVARCLSGTRCTPFGSRRP